MSVNQLAYKVTGERSILVFPDNAQKHAQYDEQVIQTFYVSHADVTELTQLLSSLIRLPSMAVQPAIQFNKTANTITVRGTTAVVQIIEQHHRAERQAARRDRHRRRDPRGEPDAREAVRPESLRVRARRRALAGGVAGRKRTITSGPRRRARTPARRRRYRSTSTPPSGVQSPPPFNLNTISRGFSDVGLLSGRADRDRPRSSKATRRPSSSPSRSCAAPKASS